MTLSRRSFFKAAGLSLAAGALGAVSLSNVAPASAQGRILGTVIDYSAGVPSARAVKAAGHIGAVRYVSQRRPGAEWMLGKPVSLKETRDFAQAGLATASVYQYGKGSTADWKRGAAGADTHAPQAINLHRAAGGPGGVPIYVAIDDNPSYNEYTSLIRPYLQRFGELLRQGGYQMGIYGNYSTIDWAIADGLGTFFWQHNWGSAGRIHPRIHLHQVRIDKDKIEGIGVDINNVYQSNWGQWTPGQSATPAPAPLPAPAQNPAPAPAFPGSSIPDINVNGSTISSEQIQQGIKFATDIAHRLG